MSIIDEARAWIAKDPDPETRAELETLVARNDVAALRERFAGRLEFGTAGLRGLLGAGPMRMNRLTVSHATAGLCAWLARQVPEARSRGICVGRDARPKSDVFERDVAEIAAGAGIPVFVFSGVVPTPVLAFSVLRSNAAGGVMITASHNPPGYNGYKVYWENGAQIIPPNDVGIAEQIKAAAALRDIPRIRYEEARKSGLIREIDELKEAYVAAISEEARPAAPRETVRIAYTALHGVAEPIFRELMSRAGFDDLHSVREQAKPDGHFPTVTFPNPEEPGAMDHVFELGDQVDADLILANDPDGDRVAAAVKAGAGFEMLSGNDIGALLADDLLQQASPGEKLVVLSTIVSSPMLGPIAAKYGARWEQTLTGHKWIQNRALQLAEQGYRYVFGYEEALGYAPSTSVRDKDGLSSALRLADMAARWKARGGSLLDARRALWEEHGFVADRQLSIRFEGRESSATMRARIDELRRNPPSAIGGQRVARMLDLVRRVVWTPAGEQPYTKLPASDLVVFELEGGHRAMVRPSGTEPKLKHYFYAVGSQGPAEPMDAAQSRAREILDRMTEALTGASGC